MKLTRSVAEIIPTDGHPAVVASKTSLHGGEGYVSPIDTNEYIAVREAILKVFGKNPISFRSGGSIPIVADFENVLGVKSILMGFGIESDAIRSPNENFPVYNFSKGREWKQSCIFYKNYSKITKK